MKLRLFDYLALAWLSILLVTAGCFSSSIAIRVQKPTGHYAVDESPSYLLWYAVESFPGEFKSSLKPK